MLLHHKLYRVFEVGPSYEAEKFDGLLRSSRQQTDLTLDVTGDICFQGANFSVLQFSWRPCPNETLCNSIQKSSSLACDSCSLGDQLLLTSSPLYGTMYLQ